jgi:ABC-type polysaccharide transport system permease subunit
MTLLKWLKKTATKSCTISPSQVLVQINMETLNKSAMVTIISSHLSYTVHRKQRFLSMVLCTYLSLFFINKGKGTCWRLLIICIRRQFFFLSERYFHIQLPDFKKICKQWNRIVWWKKIHWTAVFAFIRSKDLVCGCKLLESPVHYKFYDYVSCLATHMPIVLSIHHFF